MVFVMKKIVTKDIMIDIIRTKDISFIKRYVGRALVAIYNNQTEFEKRNNITKDSNGLGFTGTDAKSGSLLARYYIRHNNLENWMLIKWVRDERGSPRITKYWKQLNIIANNKTIK